MHVLDLFAGIGGFSLGLERAGMRTVAFCEIDEFCQRVLAKHWPGVPCYPDVCELTADRLAADGIESVDVVCGGFPCQDISFAGSGAGIDGARSGLWREQARLVGELRPRYCIVENPAALLVRGLGRVLGDLAALGFDAEWHCVPAAAIGAPHRRDRVWIVADRVGARLERHARHGDDGEESRRLDPQANRSTGARGLCRDVADADGRRQQGKRVAKHRKQQGAFWDLAHRCDPVRWRPRSLADAESDAERPGLCADESAGFWGRRLGDCGRSAWWWDAEPRVGRVAHGIPDRVDRLEGLGDALVPQIPEIIGRAIMMREAAA